MKFAEHLSAHITPEWRKQYINYDEMKSMLYKAIEEAPGFDATDHDVLKRHFTHFDETFLHYCEQELNKINAFHAEKLAEATRKFAALQNELKTFNEVANQMAKKKIKLIKPVISSRKAKDLKLAFSEFYLSLVLLQNYQTLNYTGFRKILKKHDKLFNVDIGMQWFKRHVETSRFHTSKDIDKIIEEVESVVTNELESGDRRRAMKRLRVPPLSERQSMWTTFKLGLFSGAFIVLATIVMLTVLSNEYEREDLMLIYHLYRAPFTIIFFIFLIGINIYGWRSSGVNHVLIFELDPRNHLTEQDLMELAAMLGVVWALSVLSFLYSKTLGIPPFTSPVMITGIMLAFILNPFHVLRHEARFWLVRISFRVLLAPFRHVNFADFWLGDQFNSLANVFLDYEFFLCYFSTYTDWSKAYDTSICLSGSYVVRPLVKCLPAWFRFAQCCRRYRDTRSAFPHLANAGKYSTTFLVAITGSLRSYYKSSYPNTFDSPYTWMWLGSSLISAIYAYTWDIKMDWGLFDKDAGENTFLREEIVYSKGCYYFAIVENFILRFIWAIGFYLQEIAGIISDETMTSAVTSLEVLRRFVWNFFRLENEHLNNCGNFRAVRDISVIPMDSSDQERIIRMMDEEDEVTNRNEKRYRKAKITDINTRLDLS